MAQAVETNLGELIFFDQFQHGFPDTGAFYRKAEGSGKDQVIVLTYREGIHQRFRCPDLPFAAFISGHGCMLRRVPVHELPFHCLSETALIGNRNCKYIKINQLSVTSSSERPVPGLKVFPGSGPPPPDRNQGFR